MSLNTFEKNNDHRIENNNEFQQLKALPQISTFLALSNQPVVLTPYKRPASPSRNAYTSETLQNRKKEHRDVERKRRAVINEAMERLIKLLPEEMRGKAKNKADALNLVSDYILELQLELEKYKSTEKENQKETN